MNTRTNLKRYALATCFGRCAVATCLFVLCVSHASAHALAQSSGDEGAAATQAGTPTDVARAFYTALREARFLDALRMSVYRPAIEGLSASELEELKPDFERLAQQVPTDMEFTGEQVSGEEATVFMKTGEGKDVKVEPIYLIRERGVWIIGERKDADVVRKQGKRFFFEQRIAAHEQDAEDMLKRIQAAEIAYALQHGGLYGDLKSLVDAAFIPQDILGSDTTGYNFTITPGDGAKSYTAHAEPARYNHTGRLSFFLDSSGVQKKDTGGKPFVPSKK